MTKPAAPPRAAPAPSADLRAGVALAVEATAAVAGITEAVHQSVWATLGRPNRAAPGKTRGLTGFVYRRVTDLTRLTGTLLDHALVGWERYSANAALTGSDTTATAANRKRAVALAVLNGVMGDRLAETSSPLAIPMSLRWNGADIDWSAPPAPALGKIVLFIHGLCMEDSCWRADETTVGGVTETPAVDYADALANGDATALYLRYNTGRHVFENGISLAAMMALLVLHWPTRITGITIIAHSMGGLVARSACAVAATQPASWLPLLKQLVFLGTPHAGAPLEQLGSRVDSLLATTPYSAPFRRLNCCAPLHKMQHGLSVSRSWRWIRREFSQADSCSQSEPVGETGRVTFTQQTGKSQRNAARCRRAQTDAKCRASV